MKNLLVWAVLASSLLMAKESSFPSTIPVVDMKEFENPETRQKFVDEMSQALHEYGFFAVINPGVNTEALQNAYSSSQDFFQSPLDQKKEIHDPALNGQRGFVLSERAQGFDKKDIKEFLHIGYDNNIWPSWMDLKTPMENLLYSLDTPRAKLEQAISLAMGQQEGFLSHKTENSSTLMRALYYPSNPAPGEFWAAPHTDINLFTILPMATEEGLQVWHNGEWIDVCVPKEAFIINGGDMLENLSNGYFKSSKHQVISKPNVERYSIVYFVHGHNDADFSPQSYCVNLTGGVEHFPRANELDLLAHRLVELGLAGPALIKYDAESGYIEKIEALVESNQASEAVQKTFEVWQKLKTDS